MSEAPAPGLVESRVVHDGRVVRLSIDTVRFPDGSTGELEMVRHRGAAAVLPVVGSLDQADPTILLIRQYRYAAGGYMYEVPAGIMDDGDGSWEACARRELEEETGRRAGVILPLTRVFTTPGFTDEVLHLFVAAELSEGESRLDADEFVEVVPLPLSRALAWVREGQIEDGKTVATLLFATHFGFTGPVPRLQEDGGPPGARDRGVGPRRVSLG